MDYRLELIDRASQLPAIGVTYENPKFDMKAVPTRLDIDCAKDIAAFANASGGYILVGAHENKKTGRLLRYNPLKDNDALAAKIAYERVNQDNCSPVPIIDARVVSIDHGNVVVVTVWPFPGQIVGIKVISDPKEHGKGLTTWCFPIRQGTQTHYLMPENTAMLMTPRLRVTSISLSRIPVNSNIELHYQIATEVRFPQSQSRGAEFVECSIPGNTLIVKVDNGYGTKQELSIPLEGIDAVWQDADLRKWNVALSGTVICYPGHAPCYSYYIAKN